MTRGLRSSSTSTTCPKEWPKLSLKCSWVCTDARGAITINLFALGTRQRAARYLAHQYHRVWKGILLRLVRHWELQCGNSCSGHLLGSVTWPSFSHQGQTALGEPDQILSLGKSQLPYSLFLEYLFSLGDSEFAWVLSVFDLLSQQLVLSCVDQESTTCWNTIATISAMNWQFSWLESQYLKKSWIFLKKCLTRESSVFICLIFGYSRVSGE